MCDNFVRQIPGVEPTDSVRAKAQYAEAACRNRSGRHQQQRQQGAVGANGKMRPGMRSKPEHIPEGPQNGHEGHGKHQTAFNRDGGLEYQADDDEDGQKQGQDQRGHKSSCQECA
jgi:hypothetical protein